MKIGRVDVQFESSQVMYFEGFSNYTYIHFPSRKKLYARTLLIIENQQPEGFVRIHRKYYVNRKFIKTSDEKSVTLTNNETLPISRRRLKNL